MLYVIIAFLNSSTPLNFMPILKEGLSMSTYALNGLIIFFKCCISSSLNARLSSSRASSSSRSSTHSLSLWSLTYLSMLAANRSSSPDSALKSLSLK
jgi:hypothetical protein